MRIIAPTVYTKKLREPCILSEGFIFNLVSPLHPFTMENIRDLAITYAYNILGSYEDAKDVVQDAYLKLSGSTYENIENKKAYFIRTVINLSINLKKRQKKLVDQYPGEWLPEPMATEKADSTISRKEVLSYSLMILLEKLDTKQRAVFILKEAFDYDHKEIATVLNISEENSRKIFSRAKQELKEHKAFDNKEISEDYLDKFIEVIYSADTERLEKLLHNEIITISDGGGKATAAVHPILGKERVTKFILGISKSFFKRANTRVENSIINHHPALLYYLGNKLVKCQIFDFENGYISRIYSILNPDKLRHLDKNY